MNQQAHRYEDKLLELAYGELPASEAKSIEAHVKGCAKCASALREIEVVRRQMSALAPEPAPDAGLESLMAYAQQAARRAEAGPEPKKGLRRWTYALVGGTSLFAVLIAVSVVSLQAKTALEPDLTRQVAQEEAALQAPPPPAAAMPMPAAAASGGMASPSSTADEAYADRLGAASQQAGAKLEEAQQERALKISMSSASRMKAAPKDAASMHHQYDRDDKMQNMVPGRGTVPVLPAGPVPNELAKRKAASLSDDDGYGEGVAVAKPAAPRPSVNKGGGGGIGSDYESRRGGVFAGAAKEKSRADEKQVQKSIEAEEDSIVASGQRGVQREAKQDAPAEEPVALSIGAKNSRAPAAADPMPAQQPASRTYVPMSSVASAPKTAPAPSAAPAAEYAPPPATAAAPPAPAKKSRDEAGADGRRARAEDYFQEAQSVRGTSAETDLLVSAINSGLSGASRLAALERLCKKLVGNDPRSVSFCSLWQREAGTEIAQRMAREAQQRWAPDPVQSKPASKDVRRIESTTAH